MVCADLEHDFGPHHENDHHRSSDDSIALHLNSWVSHDYVPGDDESVPCMKFVLGKKIMHKEGNML